MKIVKLLRTPLKIGVAISVALSSTVHAKEYKLNLVVI